MNITSCGVLRCNGNGHCLNDGCFCLSLYIGNTCAINISDDSTFPIYQWFLIAAFGLIELFLLYRGITVVQSIFAPYFVGPTGRRSTARGSSPYAAGQESLPRAIITDWRLIVLVSAFICGASSLASYAAPSDNSWRIYEVIMTNMSVIFGGFIVVRTFLHIHARFDAVTRRWLGAIDIIAGITYTIIFILHIMGAIFRASVNRNTIDDTQVVGRWIAWRTAYLMSLFVPAVAIALGVTVWGRTSLSFIMKTAEGKPRSEWTSLQISAARLLNVNRGLQILMCYQIMLLLLYVLGPKPTTPTVYYSVGACAAFGLLMMPFAAGVAVPRPPPRGTPASNTSGGQMEMMARPSGRNGTEGGGRKNTNKNGEITNPNSRSGGSSGGSTGSGGGAPDKNNSNEKTLTNATSNDDMTAGRLSKAVPLSTQPLLDAVALTLIEPGTDTLRPASSSVTDGLTIHNNGNKDNNNSASLRDDVHIDVVAPNNITLAIDDSTPMTPLAAAINAVVAATVDNATAATVPRPSPRASPRATEARIAVSTTPREGTLPTPRTSGGSVSSGSSGSGSGRNSAGLRSQRSSTPLALAPPPEDGVLSSQTTTVVLTPVASATIARVTTPIPLDIIPTHDRSGSNGSSGHGSRPGSASTFTSIAAPVPQQHPVTIFESASLVAPIPIHGAFPVDDITPAMNDAPSSSAPSTPSQQQPSSSSNNGALSFDI